MRALVVDAAVADTGEPQRPWIGDQLTQYPSARRRRADLMTRPITQARGDEPFKLDAGRRALPWRHSP